LKARASWIEEIWRIVVLLTIALVVGAAFEKTLLSLFIALAGYIAKYLYNLKRMADWLDEQKKTAVPVNFGLLGDICSRISRLTSRHAHRESRLTRLVDEYSASTSALPDGTVALDAKGHILWFNEAASRLLGLVAAKDIGQPLPNLFRNPEITSFIKAADYARTLETRAPGNPQLVLEVRLAPYGDGQTLLLAQDITDRIVQERVRKDFVANVSHELRTPLTVISGFIENLQADDDLPKDRLRRPLELMSQQAAMMSQLVEDLLLLARLETTSAAAYRTEVDMAAMLVAVAEECRGIRADAPNIDVQLETEKRLLGDEKQLRSAVSNLAVNAVHHTPAEGSVTLTWKEDAGGARLVVSDTGEGIAPAHIPRLTERFYRVDTGRSRDRGGTGLGLAIVKHVFKRHQAELEITSQLGRGSQFTCRFPAACTIA